MHSGVVLCFYVEARWRFPCLSSFPLTRMQTWWLTLRQPSWESAILGVSQPSWESVSHLGSQPAILGGSQPSWEAAILGHEEEAPAKFRRAMRQNGPGHWHWCTRLLAFGLFLWETEINCDLVCYDFCIFSHPSHMTPAASGVSACGPYLCSFHWSHNITVELLLHPKLSTDSWPLHVLSSAWSTFFLPSYLEYLIPNENSYS